MRSLKEFWRSVNLTGNQTLKMSNVGDLRFWRSVNLTGNQTLCLGFQASHLFWRSVNLTGNQTRIHRDRNEVFVLAQCQSDW